MNLLLRVLRKIFFIDLLKGLVITQKYFALKKITVQYPKDRLEIPGRAEYDSEKKLYMPGKEAIAAAARDLMEFS